MCRKKLKLYCFSWKCCLKKNQFKANGKKPDELAFSHFQLSVNIFLGANKQVDKKRSSRNSVHELFSFSNLWNTAYAMNLCIDTSQKFHRSLHPLIAFLHWIFSLAYTLYFYRESQTHQIYRKYGFSCVKFYSCIQLDLGPNIYWN